MLNVSVVTITSSIWGALAAGGQSWSPAYARRSAFEVKVTRLISKPRVYWQHVSIDCSPN